jgi:hypothetical protein
MRLVAGVEPVIYNQHLCGRINSTKVTFTEVFSKIGDISQSFLDTFDVILNPIIRVSADATLRMGILIPLVENITIANQTELSIESGAVRINADFVYVTSILQYP